MTKKALPREVRFCRRCGGEEEFSVRRRPNGRMQRDCMACTRDRGRRRPPERPCWAAMVRRCTDRNAVNWRYYGGAGVKVCERWIDSYEDFLADVGPRPSLFHTLHRIESGAGYQPGNVSWATWEEQHVHRRTLTVYGERKTLEEWKEEIGIPTDEIRRRLVDGWTPAQAVCVPLGKRRDHWQSARAS